jgi:hypothetical protein
VITPDVAVFSVDKGFLEIKCYGGSYSRPQGKGKLLPGPGLTITRFAIESDSGALTSFLKQILGLTSDHGLTGGIKEEKASDPTTVEGILERLNGLLDKERGGKYRFRSIGRVEGHLLMDVELEKRDPSGEIQHLIKAGSCEVMLRRRDKYVEFLFKKGVFITDDQQKPFYNDLYRMPIPNVNSDLWSTSDLKCIRID